MVKTANSGGASVSDKAQDTTAQQTQDATKTVDVTQKLETALQTTGDGDVSGPIQLALSTEAQDKLMQELQDALHQVAEGFGNLTKPGDIFALQIPFYVIDAITIPDYEDKRTGEVKVKHIFKLEFPDGVIKLTMQSDARPRKILASMFQKARALGARAKAGPYLYEKKDITGQVQPAFIFTPQPGFKAEAYQ